MSSIEESRVDATQIPPIPSESTPAESPPTPSESAPAESPPTTTTAPPATTSTTVPTEWDVTKPLTRNWAKGARLEYLDDNLDKFIDSLNHGRDASRAALDGIVNGYFRLFDWRLPLSIEPDPTKPPDPKEKLTQAETTRKGVIVLKMRTAIYNWLSYRANKIATPYKHLKNLDPSDPFAILLSRLTGIGLKPPNRIAGWQELQRVKFADYKAAFDAECQQKKIAKSHIATARNKYMKAIFDKLGDEEKKIWEERAKARHAEEVCQRNARLDRLDSLSPQERQDALRRLADFFLPIIEGASAVLGMHVSVFVGGPEPASGGALNVLSIHSGVDRAAIPRTWGEANPESFDEVTANFLSYLDTCYSAEDREAAALPQTFNSSGISSTRLIRPRRTEATHDDNDSDEGQRRAQPSKAPPTQSRRQRRQAKSSQRHSSQRHRDDDSESEGTDHSHSTDEDDSGRHSRRHKRNRPSKRRHSPVTPKKNRSRRGGRRQDPSDTSDEDPEERPPLKKSRARRRRSAQADTPVDNYSHDNESSPSMDATRRLPNQNVPPTPVDTFACPTGNSNRLPTSLKAPEISSLWPEWFSSNYKLLHEPPKMPITWSTLLATYVQLEEQTAFANPGPQSTLPAENRPAQIQWWVHRGRRQPVVISNVTTFAEEWWTWWKTMQPEWRAVRDVNGYLTVRHRVFDLAISEAPDAWSTMDKHGANGFLSVVASLGWWAQHLAKMYPRWNDWTMADPHGRCWDDAAIDAIWVMQRLAASRQNRAQQ
ncbi:hypothetical protein ONZ45_g13091 [Pleurotus djamor]|nr:hypothetical protein ONZ45_g13091 [Pleurotus djamor]